MIILENKRASNLPENKTLVSISSWKIIKIDFYCKAGHLLGNKNNVMFFH